MIALSYLLEDFLSIITSFPAIIYSVLLTVTIILALLTIVGLLDIDGPEFDFNMDGDVDLSANTATAEGLAGFMLSWGLTGVPITIVFRKKYFKFYIFQVIIPSTLSEIFEFK